MTGRGTCQSEEQVSDSDAEEGQSEQDSVTEAVSMLAT